MLRFDRWIFLGHDPAALLHDVFGQHTAAYVLMVVYKSFTYLVPLSVVAALVFTPRIREATSSSPRPCGSGCSASAPTT